MPADHDFLDGSPNGPIRALTSLLEVDPTLPDNDGALQLAALAAGMLRQLASGGEGDALLEYGCLAGACSLPPRPGMLPDPWRVAAGVVAALRSCVKVLGTDHTAPADGWAGVAVAVCDLVAELGCDTPTRQGVFVLGRVGVLWCLARGPRCVTHGLGFQAGMLHDAGVDVLVRDLLSLCLRDVATEPVDADGGTALVPGLAVLPYALAVLGACLSLVSGGNKYVCLLAWLPPYAPLTHTVTARGIVRWCVVNV